MKAWKKEPYRLDFREHDFQCVAVRHPVLGHWGGYVAVPMTHPLAGMPCGDIEELEHIQVHGGITWSADHFPLEEPDGQWWLGFDCAHAGDAVPWINYLLGRKAPSLTGGVYRDADYVEAQCRALAGQLARMLVQWPTPE